MFGNIIEFIQNLWTARKAVIIIFVILFLIVFIDKILTSLEHIFSIITGGNRND